MTPDRRRGVVKFSGNALLAAGTSVLTVLAESCAAPAHGDAEAAKALEETKVLEARMVVLETKQGADEQWKERVENKLDRIWERLNK